jgi:molybdopterin synthase sulfur carrier subunit
VSKIIVKYRSRLASITGILEENFDEENVEALLRSIRKRHGREAEKAARAMLIAKNGENIILLNRYKTRLLEGDTVSFFPLCAGG